MQSLHSRGKNFVLRRLIVVLTKFISEGKGERKGLLLRQKEPNIKITTQVKDIVLVHLLNNALFQQHLSGVVCKGYFGEYPRKNQWCIKFLKANIECNNNKKKSNFI